jgi:hypothetical protein
MTEDGLAPSSVVRLLSSDPPTACRHPVSGTVSPRSSRCFSPFPHGTGSLSVTEEYLGLEGGPPTFRQGFSCPALLEDPAPAFPYGAVTRSGPPFQTLPVTKSRTTGLVRVRSPLLAESRLMSFPPATEMFQFAGFASPSYGFRWRYPGSSPGWVAPFGDPGIADRSHLPRAFRSVLRPSSPLSAKASTRCPSHTLPTTPNGKRHPDISNQISDVGGAPRARQTLSPGGTAFHRMKTHRVEPALQPFHCGHTTRFFTMLISSADAAPAGRAAGWFRSCCRVSRKQSTDIRGQKRGSDLCFLSSAL